MPVFSDCIGLGHASAKVDASKTEPLFLTPLAELGEERFDEVTHNDYCTRQFEKGDTEEKNISLAPWPRLPEDLKDTNRAQAEFLIENVHEYGYRVVPMRSLNEPFLEFDREDPMVLELAIKEHNRYVKMKLAQGYCWGPVSKKEEKINETLIEWDKLPSEEKEKDIETVLELPKRLAKVSLKLEYDQSLDRRVNKIGQNRG